MAQATAIEWTDLSWNPVHGCSKVSPGCAHCYAETLSLRYAQTRGPWAPANAAQNVQLKPHKLREPLSGAKAWQGLGAAAAAAGKTEGKLVFVNSMSDLFHELVPEDFITRVFNIMGAASRHTFQVLTKRPERMARVVADYYARMAAEAPVWDHAARELVPYQNVWLGVSIENRRFVHRADELRATPAAVRFISAEPLLGPLLWNAASDADRPPDTYDDGHEGPELDLDGIDWLIVGGESGPGHRPMREEWVRDLRDACLDRCLACRVAENGRGDDEPWQGGCMHGARPALFFKQWGGARPGGEALLDGREWHEFPAVTA